MVKNKLQMKMFKKNLKIKINSWRNKKNSYPKRKFKKL